MDITKSLTNHVLEVDEDDVKMKKRTSENREVTEECYNIRDDKVTFMKPIEKYT